MPKPLRIYLGWDPKDVAAFHTLCHSIYSRASSPVTIQPLIKRQLLAYKRDRGSTESTEFSLTRFLVPYLSNYEGFSLFMDPDMLCLVDLDSLWEDVQRESDKSVWVCKHQYTPSGVSKMDGQVQTAYPRKNWSSFILFDNSKCHALTPTYVNSATGLDLHRFNWLEDDEIGSLPLEWNYLVGEGNQSPKPPKVIHWTNGGPWMEGYQDCQYAAEWYTESARVYQTEVIHE